MDYPNHVIDVHELSTKTVVVFRDRAEVKRIVEVDLESGRSLVSIQASYSLVSERQSIRVEGRKAALIQDVQYQECQANSVDDVNDQLRLLEKEKNDLEAEKAKVSDEIHVLRKRLEVLDGVAGQIGHSVLMPSDAEGSKGSNGVINKTSAFLLCKDAMDNLTNFLDYYGSTASETRQELRDKEHSYEMIKANLETAERHLDQMRCKYEYDNHKRNINITVDMEQAGRAEIYISYQVYCASWRPAYDIRATTAGLDSECNNAVTVLYYGLVEQKTDEDWRDAEIVLSTAAPCANGSAPSLPTLTAAFQRQSNNYRPRNYSARRKPMSNGSEEDMGFGSFDYNEITDAAALQQRLNVARTCSDNESLFAIPENMPCLCFAIETPATILSDGQNHKVTITEIELDPIFIHETVPSKAGSVYLSVSVVNSSSLALLPGQASVFLNNGFISTTHLKTIMPGEEFQCALGIDPSIKVEYKPSEVVTEQVGFMSKSSLSMHEQVITLRNAKPAQNVKVTVREPIPKAVDEKIRVAVLSPDLRGSRSEARLNKDHNLEWTCALEPGEQRDLVVRWSVECPVGETLVFSTFTAAKF
ncbi:Protein C52D10.1 [Aphelenchoides avenae]|nr:Protein C52D10.1 [Aphelenchus avenae]